MIKQYITRQHYIDRIKPYIGKNIIKVITGQRRVGKSYLLFQLMDVVKRHRIRNIASLERLTIYLADNAGSLVSAKKISDFLKSQKTNISPNVVFNYLSHTANSRNKNCSKFQL